MEEGVKQRMKRIRNGGPFSGWDVAKHEMKWLDFSTHLLDLSHIFFSCYWRRRWGKKKKYWNRVGGAVSFYGLLCGAPDWPMPTIKELEGIVSSDRMGPTIDTGYFPNTPLTPYVWSGSPYASDSNSGWIVNFEMVLRCKIIA